MSIGCSSFNRKWEQATSEPVPTDDVMGPWEGKWQSRKGHGSGKLLCVIEAAPQTAGPSADAPYVAHFRATFWGIFKSTYSIPLTRHRDAENVFAGKKDLGWLAGGLYTYGAEITPTTFDASYQSQSGDSGIFQLARPK